MESNKSGFDSFKSKKVLKSSFKSSISPSKPPTLPHLDMNPWDSKGPERPVSFPRRARNRCVALSLKDAREAAQKLRKSDPNPPTQALLVKLSNSPPPATPVKDVHSYEGLDPSSNGAAATVGTPALPDCTPAKLMSATPSLRYTKRCYMSPEGDDAIQSPNKLVRRATRSRSLKFDTPKKGANIQDDVQDCECSSPVHNDLLDILPETPIQSIMEKESKAKLEQDPAISQAKWRKQMIAGLPKLFSMIYFLFQSIRRTVITKKELMHRLVLSYLDNVDRREVEEQLRLLQELVPEWIYEKVALRGDLLICVNKISCPELIRTRLAAAK